MDGTTKLIHQLGQLMTDVDEPELDIIRSLDDLARVLRAAIPSYCGLVVHLHRHGQPITLTAYEPQDGPTAVASLRWATARPGSYDETSLTLYASQAGSFVDLAADLSYVLGGPPLHPDRQSSDGLVRLDRDLPPPSRVSAITGVEALTTINRATGVLIDRGTHPQQAMLELARQAAGAGLDPYTYARTLLGHPVGPSDT
jgi:hypothetical protein